MDVADVTGMEATFSWIRRSPTSQAQEGLAPDDRISASRPVRVLIVDDDQAFLSAASHALAGATVAFEVTTTETGAGALALLDRTAEQGELPDFVLLDYHLPDTTAPSVLKRLAATPALASLPVLVLTRDAREEAREDALLAGASEFATKPSRLVALRDVVVRFWENHAPSTHDPAR